MTDVLLGRWGFWVRLGVVLAAALSGVAFGQSAISLEDSPIVDAACSIFSTLTGPGAFIVGLLVLVVGGISIAVGGSRAIGPVVWGVVGVGIAISASNIAKAIFPDSIAWCNLTPAT